MPADPPVALMASAFPNLVVGYRYTVTIGASGPVNALFTEVTGLSVEREVLEHAEGGVNDHVHYLPKGVKYGRVTLRRGLGDQALWTWFCGDSLANVTVKRQNVTITLYNSDYSQSKKWNLTNAYPVKWTGPDLKSDSNQVAFESLEFVHDGFTLVDWA